MNDFDQKLMQLLKLMPPAAQGQEQGLSAPPNVSMSATSQAKLPLLPPALTDQLWNKTDYSQPEPPTYDPTLRQRMAEPTTQYNEGMGDAYDKYGGVYKPSTFDKIAKYGTLAAAVLGAVGDKNNQSAQSVLGLLSGLGSGYLQHAPDRFYNNQNRLFNQEAGRLGADYNAAMAPLTAEQQTFEDQNKNWAKLDTSRRGWAGLGENAANIRLTTGRGSTPSFEAQMLRQAYEWIRDGVYTEATLPEPYRGLYTHKLGKSIEDTRQEHRAATEYENKYKGFTQQFLDQVRKDNPDIYGEWKASGEPINALYDKVDRGEIGTRVPQSFLGVDAFWPDTYKFDPQLQQAKDSSLFYGNQANLPGYINERLTDPNWIAREGQMIGGQQESPQIQKLREDLNAGYITQETFDQWVRYYQGGGQ